MNAGVDQAFRAYGSGAETPGTRSTAVIPRAAILLRMSQTLSAAAQRAVSFRMVELPVAVRTVPKNYYRYHFVLQSKVVHRGITKDLERSRIEHRQQWPIGWIKQIGPLVTHETALAWERAGGSRI